MQCIFQSHMLLCYLCIQDVHLLVSLLRIIESCLYIHLTYIQCHICMYMWDVCSVSKMYIYIYTKMYVYLYLYACKMYIYGYRAACLACICTCESCESCLSLSLSRARALSLSLQKMLYSTSLQVQERPPKDTQLE